MMKQILLLDLNIEQGKIKLKEQGFKTISDYCGNGNDESLSGELTLFNPSSTTFVKHFISTSNTYQNSNYSMQRLVAGYFNLTSQLLMKYSLK
jgi:hypothetical protein